MEELIRASAALVFVLSIILFMGWAGKRYANSRSNVSNTKSDLRIVEWRGMDARRKLAVVHWDGKEHLLCLSQTDQTLIASRPAPELSEIETKSTQPTSQTIGNPAMTPKQFPLSLLDQALAAVNKIKPDNKRENS